MRLWVAVFGPGIRKHSSGVSRGLCSSSYFYTAVLLYAGPRDSRVGYVQLRSEILQLLHLAGNAVRS
jgi:hypothetical protein